MLIKKVRIYPQFLKQFKKIKNDNQIDYWILKSFINNMHLVDLNVTKNESLMQSFKMSQNSEKLIIKMKEESNKSQQEIINIVLFHSLTN